MSDNQKKSLGKDIDHHAASGIEGVDDVRIDFELIPDHVGDDLAATTLAAVKSFLRQPGGREKLDEKITAKKLDR